MLLPISSIRGAAPRTRTEGYTVCDTLIDVVQQGVLAAAVLVLHTIAPLQSRDVPLHPQTRPFSCANLRVTEGGTGGKFSPWLTYSSLTTTPTGATRSASS